jgi:hypothetical protein
MAKPLPEQISAIDMAALSESYIQQEIASSPFRRLLERQGEYPKHDGVFRLGTRHDRFWRKYQMNKDAGGVITDVTYTREIIVVV